jgi:hypothetical protein
MSLATYPTIVVPPHYWFVFLSARMALQQCESIELWMPKLLSQRVSQLCHSSTMEKTKKWIFAIPALQDPRLPQSDQECLYYTIPAVKRPKKNS